MLLTSCTRSRVYYVRNYRGREHEARASCFIRRENEAGTDGGQRRERIESDRLRIALIALNLPRGFYEIYSGTGAI